MPQQWSLTERVEAEVTKHVGGNHAEPKHTRPVQHRIVRNNNSNDTPLTSSSQRNTTHACPDTLKPHHPEQFVTLNYNHHCKKREAKNDQKKNKPTGGVEKEKPPGLHSFSRLV